MRIELRRDAFDRNVVYLHLHLPGVRAAGKRMLGRMLWFLLGALVYRAYLILSL